MTNPSEFFGFRIILPPEAHSVAEKFQRYQDNIQKGKQVYRNSLAVYAVNLYLHHLGFDTDLEASNSWDYVWQTLMDTADLEIKNYGKIECRPVDSNAELIHIPAEVWFESNYCIAVEIEDIATEAKLLGFIEKTITETISRSQLHPLAELPELLQQEIQNTQLNRWLEGVFDKNWQITEKVLAYKREKIALGTARSNRKHPPISRTKKIDLGLLFNRKSVALVITIQPEIENKTNILVQLIPMDRDEYLTPGMRLKVILESDTAEIKAREADNIIQLRFIEPSQSKFTVQISLGDTVITENFTV
ncbi:MAG: DUF1822 family protein [Rivularia sp. (in: Bacteria)]|nr:DUF1822 family protein [Rivularia sp. MS3]